MTDEERREVCQIALAAVATGELGDSASERRMFDDKRFPFPADVFTELGADALVLAGVTRSEPVALDDFAERAERSGVDTVASFDRSIDRVTTIRRIESGR